MEYIAGCDVHNMPSIAIALAFANSALAQIPPVIYNHRTISSHVTGEKCLIVISLAMRWSSTGEREISI